MIVSEENTKYRFRKSTETQTSFIGVREGEHPLMIAFHAEKLSQAFPYIDLKFVSFGPDTSHAIILEFASGWEVKIVGHNLGPLFQMIVEQNAAEISAQSKARLVKENESSSFAEEIEFFVRVGPK